APTPELYRLAADPREATNVADEFPDVVEQLRGELRRVREAQGGSALVPGLVQGEDVERLEALGYVASARELPTGLDPASLRDPKDGLELSRMLEEARALAQTGRVRPAIAVLGRLLAQDPDNPAAIREMSRFQGEIGEAGQAEAWLTRLVALRPDDPDAHALLAESRMGRAGRLRREGQIDAATALDDVALEDLRRAVEHGSLVPGVYLNLGRLYGMRGAQAQAEAALRRGLEIDGRSFDANLLLAHALCRADRGGEAEPYVRAARRLMGSDPHKRQRVRALSTVCRPKNGG
ncbi:MAG: tetratricopeptide repeat protein, partial [Myxococcota bacterium]